MLGSLLLAAAGSATAQNLRYSNYREVGVPDYATFRLGPFYSNWAFSQTAGYRYSRSSQAQTDVIRGEGRGQIQEDGSELPLISTMAFRNYLIINRRTDVEASVTVGYEYYPLGTQDGGWFVTPPGAGITGDFSLQFQLQPSQSPDIKCRIYDRPYYRIDYVDVRGQTDLYGGRRYEHFDNVLGMDVDWLTAKDQNLAISASRSDVIPFGSRFDDVRSTTYGESQAYEWQVNPLWMVGADASYSYSMYPSSDRGNAFGQNYGGHTELAPTERTKLNGALGYSLYKLVSPGPGEDSGSSAAVVGSAGLKTQLSKHVSHGLSVNRTQSGGFRTALEIDTSVSYTISWASEWLTAGAFATYSKNEPRLTDLPGYSAVTYGLSAKHPLTKRVDLLGSTSYDTRYSDSPSTVSTNSPVTASLLEDPTLTTDYSTWVSSLGLAFQLFKEVSLSLSAEHAERFSDNDSIAFTRDTFWALMTYTHQF